MLYTYLKDIYDATERKRTVEHLTKLRDQLTKQLPPKKAEDTLLLATWNIRQFTDNRRKESYMYIAEILSRFDLIAVQEVKEQMKGLTKVMNILGKDWTYIVTDVSEKLDGGNGERIAFIYDKRKVSFKNMAGEIVLPSDKLIQGMQFARTPFCVSFQAGWFKFNLATVHIFYGDEKQELERRKAEIRTIGEFLSARAKDEKTSYIILGDFNIPEVGDEYMNALESSGFHIPSRIKDHPTNFGEEAKHYDQIAFNLQLEEGLEVLNEDQMQSGAFDFTESVYNDADYEEYIDVMPAKKGGGGKRTGEAARKYFHSTYRITQMSDHMPLWVELKVDFSGQYIEKQKQAAIKELEAEAKAKEEEAKKAKKK